MNAICSSENSLSLLPKIHENVEPVEEHVWNLGCKTDVWHKVFGVPNGLITVGVVRRQFVVLEIIRRCYKHIPRRQRANSMQNEDEEDYPESVTRRLRLQLGSIHRHALEVKLIIGKITPFPCWRESNWLCRLISTCEVEEKSNQN